MFGFAARARLDDGLSPGEVAQLRALIARIDMLDTTSDTSSRPRGRHVLSVRKRATVVATVLLGVGMLIGVAACVSDD